MPDLCIWNKCNSHCIMCTNSAEFKLDSGYSYDDLVSRLKSIKRGEDLSLKFANTRNINFTGGEPTINPDFLKILDYIAKKMPEYYINLISNGRKFYYPEFTQKTLSYKKIHNIIIPIHGYDKKSHQAITQTPGSWDQTIQGIRNILKYKSFSQNLEIRTVIQKLNYQCLDKILSFIKNEFPEIKTVVLVFLEVEGQAVDNLKNVLVTYSQAREHVSKLFKFTKEIRDLRFYHFPLCTIDAKLWPFVWRSLDKNEITYVDQCSQCKVKDYCLSVHKDYLENVGQEEFKPIKNLPKIILQNDPYRPILKVED